MKIIYDFDGTLTPYPVPKFRILEKCGIDGNEYDRLFQELKSEIITKDLNLFEVFYQTFLDKLREANIEPIKDNLIYGSDLIKYNNGLINFLENTVNLDIENYLLSSNIKEYLENTSVAHYFNQIYGTTFKKNNQDYIIDYLMTDSKKVSIIEQLTGGNCSDVIYIGDGLTDLPAMKYVKNNGGRSIFLVHDSNVLDDIDSTKYISFATSPDYSEESELYKYIMQTRNMIEK